jgi:hypothetical protein
MLHPWSAEVWHLWSNIADTAHLWKMPVVRFTEAHMQVYRLVTLDIAWQPWTLGYKRQQIQQQGSALARCENPKPSCAFKVHSDAQNCRC